MTDPKYTESGWYIYGWRRHPADGEDPEGMYYKFERPVWIDAEDLDFMSRAYKIYAVPDMTAEVRKPK